MTITQILDGLARLGELRLAREAAEREAAEREAAKTQDAGKISPAQDDTEPHQAETNERR